MQSVVVVGIAGGTGAGKSTLAQRLLQALGDDNVVYLVHDSYYKDLSHLPLNERVTRNFDHPDALQTSMLLHHIQELKQGRSVQVPIYDFHAFVRTGQTKEQKPRNIMLVDGILLFCDPQLIKEFDVKVFVDADSDIRLMRRLDRDVRERGRTVESVLAQYVETVRPMHQQWVEPCKQIADLIIYSTKHSMDTAVLVLTNHLKSFLTEAAEAASLTTLTLSAPNEESKDVECLQSMSDKLS